MSDMQEYKNYKQEEKDFKWYIVHTQHGYENKVKERIDKRKKENGMDDLIVDIYIPSQTVSVTKNGKKVNKEEFSYPGYVLVKMIMNDVTQSMIRRTPGVAGFIGSHATTKEEGQIIPTPLSETDVDRIFEDMESKSKNQINEIIGMDFDIGEKVQVIDGPFNGLNGIIENVNTDKGKVTVKIEIFGRSTPTELDFNKVKKL